MDVLPPSDRPRRKKSLGQHHLRSGELCRPLVEFLAPAGRRVVEIGPGAGALTGELLAAGARVLALEVDPGWAGVLRSRLREPRLTIVLMDALDFAFDRLAAGSLVAGNLPYQIGTALVERVLAAGARIERAAFLLQREVVDRLAAGPGDAAYGALSVLTQARAEVRRLGRVRPGSFVPPPRVESAFVGLRARTPAVPAEDWPAFERLVRDAFAQRRKSLANSLGARYDRGSVESALAAFDRPSRVRAEELALGELVELGRRLGTLPPASSRTPEGTSAGDTILRSIGDAKS